MVTSDNTGKIEVGNRIGGQFQVYQILGGEGKSGMGIVYVCYDHESKNVFALKTFQDKFLFSKNIRDCFKHEALAWVHLEKHPYIVQALWVLKLNNRLFINLEYIAPDSNNRNTLTHYLQSNISLKQTLEWSIQFCHGMEYAYSHGVTPHRDIKPDNIMITSDGFVKITDFGLAKLWDKTDIIKELDNTPIGNTLGLSFIKRSDGMLGVGTPPWMAPEQFEGNADVRSDIYSFGVALYQMVNHGSLPFFNPNYDYEDYHHAHKNTPVPQINSVLFPVIKCCLSKNPGNRYQDFKELREELEKLYKKEVGQSIPSIPEGKKLEEWEHFNKGISLYTLGLYNEAINEYNKIIRLRPDYADAYINLGIALYRKGLVDEAINAYKKALRLKPEDADVYNNLGVAFKAIDLLDEAITAYNKAIQLKPDYAKAYCNLGVVFIAKGFLDEAVIEYKKAIRLKPNYAEAYNNLGVALKNKGLLDEAIIEYKKAIQLNPDYAEAYGNLGIALEALGHFDLAIEAYQNFIRYAPPQYAERVEQIRELIEELKGEV